MTGLMSMEEAAQQLRCTPLTLRTKSYCLKHGIKAVKLGRRLYFDAADIQGIIERNNETPKEERR
jgi:hypothetical protein